MWLVSKRIGEILCGDAWHLFKTKQTQRTNDGGRKMLFPHFGPHVMKTTLYRKMRNAGGVWYIISWLGDCDAVWATRKTNRTMFMCLFRWLMRAMREFMTSNVICFCCDNPDGSVWAGGGGAKKDIEMRALQCRRIVYAAGECFFPSIHRSHVLGRWPAVFVSCIVTKTNLVRTQRIG